MKRLINVHSGEVMAGCGDVILKSDTKASCFVIAAYDSMRKIGALAHDVFLAGHQDDSEGVERRNETAQMLDRMIEDMSILGASPNSIEVRLVAAENINGAESHPSYGKRISSILELLKERNIPIKTNSSNGKADAHFSLDVESGSIVCS